MLVAAVLFSALAVVSPLLFYMNYHTVRVDVSICVLVCELLLIM